MKLFVDQIKKNRRTLWVCLICLFTVFGYNSLPTISQLMNFEVQNAVIYFLVYGMLAFFISLLLPSQQWYSMTILSFLLTSFSISSRFFVSTQEFSTVGPLTLYNVSTYLILTTIYCTLMYLFVHRYAHELVDEYQSH